MTPTKGGNGDSFTYSLLMAKSVAQRVTEAGGEVRLRTVPELVPQKVIEADARLV